MSNDNASETSPLNIPDANLTVSDRIDELKGRIKTHQDALFNNGNLSHEFEKIKKASEQVERAFTDFDWVNAFIESGASDDQITKVWEIKDRNAAKERKIRTR